MSEECLYEARKVIGGYNRKRKRRRPIGARPRLVSGGRRTRGSAPPSGVVAAERGVGDLNAEVCFFFGKCAMEKVE